MANQPQAAGGGASTRPLWFTPPDDEENRRRALTRERVVAEALTVISADGAEALSMRALASPPRRGSRRAVPPRPQQGAAARPHPRRRAGRGRLPGRSLPPLDRAGHCARPPAAGGPGKPPRHRRAAQDPRPAQPALPRPGRGIPRARCTRPACPGRQAALAYRLIHDYILGFALADRTTASEQRIQDTTTRRDLHAFLRSLPADRFPALTAYGEHVWADDRDERFTASLRILLNGLQATLPAHQPGSRQPEP